jgi:hypothetical protein
MLANASSKLLLLLLLLLKDIEDFYEDRDEDDLESCSRSKE